MNRQQKFEIDSHNRAVKKLERDLVEAKQKAYFSSTLQARQSITQWALPLADELIDYLKTHADGRASTRASAVASPEIIQWLDIVSPQIISVIVLKSVFDSHGVFEKLTISKLANLIGTRLEDEARFRFYEITAPEEVVKAAWKRVTEAGSSPRYRRVSTKLITEKMLDDIGVDENAKWKRWSDHYRITLGTALVEFCYMQGLITKETVMVTKTRKATFVHLSPETLAVQEILYSKMREISYMAYPLIEPPLPWLLEDGEARDNTSGGYHTDFIREQLPLCRGRYYKSSFGTQSIQFLNMLGDVKWKLYEPCLDVASKCIEKGWSIGSMKNLFRDPRLDESMPMHLTELPKDHPDRKDWRREMKALHDEHEKLRRKSIRSRQAINIAQDFKSHDGFYLSWSNDYRGRCYSQQPWLNPQTTEMEKSLLTFAEGSPLTDRGELWAAQAVGAAFVGSTKPFAERTQWTFDNKELIKAVAEDPLGTQSLWTGDDCKEPWTFLQLATEWNDVVLDRSKREWNVPIGADATASGLQLLSSMLRDPVGMKYANVIPPENLYDPPQDSYLKVLGIARDKADSDPSLAHLVPFMVHRNIGKVTMVHLYGAKHKTIRDRVIKVFVDKKQFGKNKEVTWRDVRPDCLPCRRCCTSSLPTRI